MKKIEAFLQPLVLDGVVRALQKIEGLSGMIVSDAVCVRADCGNDPPDINNRIEVIVADHQVEAVLEAIVANTNTGNSYDDSIIVVPME